jgi:hypothetical protein
MPGIGTLRISKKRTKAGIADLFQALGLKLAFAFKGRAPSSSGIEHGLKCQAPFKFSTLCDASLCACLLFLVAFSFRGDLG